MLSSSVFPVYITNGTFPRMKSQKPTACSARRSFLFRAGREQEEFYITDDGQSVRKTEDSVIEEFEM